MGSLAFWGGVAGAGKGLVQNAQRQEKIDMAALEEARMKRVAELENKYATERQQAGFTHDAAMQGANLAARTSESAADRAFTNQQAVEQRAFLKQQQQGEMSFKSSEGAKDRESAERIAGMRAVTAASAKAAERFERTTLKTKEATKLGIPLETDSPAIYDKDTKRYYIQQGDKYVLPGMAVRAPRDIAGAMKELMANPELADDFLADYGFLPMQFVSSLPAQRAAAK